MQNKNIMTNISKHKNFLVITYRDHKGEFTRPTLAEVLNALRLHEPLRRKALERGIIEID